MPQIDAKQAAERPSCSKIAVWEAGGSFLRLIATADPQNRELLPRWMSRRNEAR